MVRQAKGCVALATLLVLLFVLYTVSFSGSTPSGVFFKRLMLSRDNVNELWEDSPFRQLFAVSHASDEASVGITDASEDVTSLNGDGSVLQRPVGNAKMNKEWLQRKVGYLYQIQGAQMQLDFKRRPKKHQVVDGVVDPISHADSERQKKDYAEMIKNQKKERKEKAEKEAKEAEEKKAKEEEEKRKKEEELRKSEEEKKQQREKEEKEEASKRAKAEQEKIQAKADEEGKAKDAEFLAQDMKAHLVMDTDFPKYKSDSKVFVVTLVSEKSEKDAAIIANRKEYCATHGYECLFPDKDKIPDIYKRWSTVHTLRDYFSKGTVIKPNDWVWFVKNDVLITNMETSIADQLLAPESLKARLSYGSRFQSVRGHYHPTVRYPDSISDVSKLQFIVSRGPKSMNLNSFLIRNTELMHFWLDVWDDHLIAHVGMNDASVQADVLHYLFLNHPTLRQRVGVVSPRLLMSKTGPQAADQVYLKWNEGDLAGQYDCSGPDVEMCNQQWNQLYEAAKASSNAVKSQMSIDSGKSDNESSKDSTEKDSAKGDSSDKDSTKDEKSDSKENKEIKPEGEVNPSEKEKEVQALKEASTEAEAKQIESNTIEKVKEAAKEAAQEETSGK